MLFILNLAIGAGSGLALSIPFLGWLEGTVHNRMRNTAQKGMAQCSTAQGKGKCEISGWHTAGVFLFAFLLAGILTLTGVPAFQEFHFDANINMIPMAEFFSNSRQYFENTLLFMPLGFLVPLLWRREQMVEKTVSIGFLFSLFIEAAQLFSFRATDIDDLLMNTMGTWLGYLLFLAINRIFPRTCGRFGVGEKPEPGSLWAVEEAGGQEAKAEGRLGPENHPLVRPDTMEAEAVHRLLVIAKEAKAPVMVVHLTNRKAYEEILRARENGQTVFAETCPQYLVLDDSVYSKPDFEGAKYVCAPPIRKKEDQDCLWKALAEGQIQTVATDQCSFTLAQKAMGKEDFTKMGGGLPGVQTRGTLR